MSPRNIKATSEQLSSCEKDMTRAPLHLSSPFTHSITCSKSHSGSKYCILGLLLSLYLPRCDAMIVNSPSTSQMNALALLNTARLLREQRSTAKGIGDRSSLQRCNSQTLKQLRKHVAKKTSRPNNTSWETLFDGDTAIDFERQDAFISSRVQAHLPSIKSLRTSLGSEIPEMELYLQMEAAKVRAVANGHANAGAAAALAFMDLHHQKASAKTQTPFGNGAPISAFEKVAMSSLPSQLPELATSVLSRQDTSLGDVRPDAAVKISNARERNVEVVPMEPIEKSSFHLKLKGGDNSKVKFVSKKSEASIQEKVSVKSGKVRKIDSEHVSTIMSTRKVLHVSAEAGERKESQPQQVHSPTARVSHDEEIQLARIIQRGVELHSIKSKFEEQHGRDITRQEWTKLAKLDGTKQLRRMVSDYRQAKSKLVMANMGLVHAVVRTRLGVIGSSSKVTKTDKNGISYEELVQEGSLGLIRAAELFDPSRGLRFSTYATIWIKGILGNSNMSETITLPLREKNKWNKIQTAISDLQLEKGTKDDSNRPSDNKIAAMSGLGIEEVKVVMTKMNRAKNVLSLDYQYDTQTRSGGVNNRFEALQNDKNLMDDVDLVERLHVRADVIAALARNLDPREARLVRLRYGLNDGRTRSIKDCAEAMGISQSRAQQLATGCLKKLREADDAESLQEYLLSVA
jgi:RNA polymerase primary sigma factor